jgi:hypothetical protein
LLKLPDKPIKEVSMLLLAILGVLIGLCIVAVSLTAKYVYDFDTEHDNEIKQKQQSKAPTHITGIGKVNHD